MQRLDVLNTRERKSILKLLESQFGFSGQIDEVILKNSQEKLFIAKKELFDLDMEKLRIDSLGLYFGQLVKGELRLSVEGSQIVGPDSETGIVDLDDAQRASWMRGDDLDLEDEKGWVLIRSGSDFIGCGKSTGNRILNYFPKTRRIASA